MKKLVINLSDSDYEKFRFEAISQKKGIQEVIRDRILYKPFDEEVIDAFNDFIDKEMSKIIGD